MSDDKMKKVDDEPEEKLNCDKGKAKLEMEKFEEYKAKYRRELESIDIEIDDLYGDQRFLAEGMGIDAYRITVQLVGGGYLYVPQYHKLIKRKTKKYVYEVFLEWGADYHKTATLFGLSVSTIRRYVRDYKRYCNYKAKKMN